MGFGFLILIIISAYTANLATFLALPGIADYIGTMEQAIEKNAPICIIQRIGDEASRLWPEANMVHINNTEDYLPLFQAYGDGICDLIVIGEVVSQIELDRFCELNLVFTSSLVMALPQALPLGEDISRKLSYSLYNGGKQSNIFYEQFQSYEKPITSCNLDYDSSQVASDTAALTPANLLLPFLILFACSILSYLVSIYADKYNVKGIADCSKVISSTEKEISHLSKGLQSKSCAIKNSICSTSKVLVVPIIVDEYQAGMKDSVERYLLEIEQTLKKA